jgi:predicted phosphate transport protein (TIGR00153 family)
MKIDTIIQWLMPHEERFHVLLEKDTQNLLKGARLFQEIANAATLDERRIKTVQLKALEHDGDQVTRQVFEALNSTFITPLDREDIRSLAKDLDDILDYLESVAQSLVVFELDEVTEAMSQFARILVNMTEEIDKASGMVWDLNNQKQIQESIVRISELENQGDALYAAVIAQLFKSPDRDSIKILKWKLIYDGLEEACDACKDYTHVLGNVVIKNA